MDVSELMNTDPHSVDVETSIANAAQLMKDRGISCLVVLGEDGIEGIQAQISNWKNDLILPDEALAQAKTPQEQTAASVYMHYQRTLKAYNAVDFDDLITRATELVEKGKFIPRWKYILVDEFQDISRARCRLLEAIKRKNNNSKLFAVGDDWQSIEAFAGSDIKIMT